MSNKPRNIPWVAKPHQFVETNVKAYVDYLEDTILVLTEQLKALRTQTHAPDSGSGSGSDGVDLTYWKDNGKIPIQPQAPVTGGQIAQRARDRYDELAHKGWDYRSFYNGFLEGATSAFSGFGDVGTAGNAPSDLRQSDNASLQPGDDIGAGELSGLSQKDRTNDDALQSVRLYKTSGGTDKGMIEKIQQPHAQFSPVDSELWSKFNDEIVSWLADGVGDGNPMWLARRLAGFVPSMTQPQAPIPTAYGHSATTVTGEPLDTIQPQAPVVEVAITRQEIEDAMGCIYLEGDTMGAAIIGESDAVDNIMALLQSKGGR